MTADDGLVLEPEMLQEAGLQGRLCVLIGSGEIRILPLPPATSEDLVQELAGCLGRKPAAAYDFDLTVPFIYRFSGCITWY